MKVVKIIIAMLLIISISIVTLPYERETEAFVITGTVVAITAGVILAGLGITYATHDDFQKGVNSAFRSLSDDAKNTLAVIANNPKGTYIDAVMGVTNYVAVPKPLRQEFENYAYEKYVQGGGLQGDETEPVTVAKVEALSDPRANEYEGGASISTAVASPEIVFTSTTADNYFTEELPNGVVREVIVNTTNTNVRHIMPNGMAYVMKHTTYGHQYGQTAIIKSHIMKYDNYNSLTYTGQIPFGKSSQHTYWVANMYLEDYLYNDNYYDGLVYLSSGRPYILINGTPIYLYDASRTWQSIGHFLHDMVNSDIVINANVIGRYLPKIGDDAISETQEGTIAVPLPQTADDVMTLTPDKVVLQDATIDLTLADSIPQDIPDTTSEDINKFKIPSLLMKKFPFSVPFDVYAVFTAMQATPKVPEFEYVLNMPIFNIHHTFNLSLAQFEPIARVVRWFLIAIFTLGLILITRKLIKG